ncbi:hypothetical protein L209DRAFT_41960 [Thermothelomyces heterothallicus CBS 203.75]
MKSVLYDGSARRLRNKLSFSTTEWQSTNHLETAVLSNQPCCSDLLVYLFSSFASCHLILVIYRERLNSGVGCGRKDQFDFSFVSSNTDRITRHSYHHVSTTGRNGYLTIRANSNMVLSRGKKKTKSNADDWDDWVGGGSIVAWCVAWVIVLDGELLGFRHVSVIVVWRGIGGDSR